MAMWSRSDRCRSSGGAMRWARDSTVVITTEPRDENDSHATVDSILGDDS